MNEGSWRLELYCQGEIRDPFDIAREEGPTLSADELDLLAALMRDDFRRGNAA